MNINITNLPIISLPIGCIGAACKTRSSAAINRITSHMADTNKVSAKVTLQ